MPNWQEAQRMLQQARTPEEKAEALKAMGGVIPPELANAHLATMSKGSNNNDVRLGDIPDCDDPEVFERMKNLSS